MKKFFGLYIFYIAYLLILGQGCSAIDGVDHVVSVPLPSFENAPKLNLKGLSDLSYKHAPEKEVVETEAPVLETSVALNTVVKRKELNLKPVVKTETIKPSKLKKLINNSSSNQIRPIQKSYRIQEDAKETKNPESLKTVTEVSKNLVNDQPLEKEELSLRTGIEHFGFQSNSQVKIVSFEEDFGMRLESKLAALANLEEKIAENQIEESKEDVVRSIQSAPQKNAKAYDPTDPEMLAMFDRPQVDLNEIAAKKVNNANEKLNNENQEPFLLDYSDTNKQENPKTGIAQVAAAPISSAVSRVIKREMGPPKRDTNLNKALLALNTPTRRQGNQGSAQIANEENGKNSVGLYALEASLNNGFKGDVANFNFVPSYDTNETLEDYGNGFIKIDYSLENSTGVLRGTLLKNFFIRTSFEIPLGSEYSKFEIPMITQDSIIDYLDENNLEGYGGYYLADLGEYLEDVELEKGNSGYRNTYEHRLLLDDNFKKVGEGKPYRYVLFIGVAPGNITVRYLGVNGQETSKITFIAPDELLYDFSQLERPIELNVETKLQNTLGRKPTPLNVEPNNFINFLSGEKANQTSPGSYVLKTPWKIKGSRSYYELNYLDDSIFIGLDGDKSLELPSREFIGETLRAFNMDGINRECLLQLNFGPKVREFKVLGESERGPAVFDMAFLDEDGVFSAELSPISKKAFLLGNEDGVFNIKITYENGNEDYLRTYCSTSTYLLEQL
jgi:hypothetical protein